MCSPPADANVKKYETQQDLFAKQEFPMKAYRTNKSGFTLVEILIVVIILGILAAIVIPQFTNASTDARKSNLTSQLQTLRSQIALYKLQHNETVPDLTNATWDQFTKRTKQDGTVHTTTQRAP